MRTNLCSYDWLIITRSFQNIAELQFQSADLDFSPVCPEFDVQFSNHTTTYTRKALASLFYLSRTISQKKIDIIFLWKLVAWHRYWYSMTARLRL
ncbi:hypothetical protein BRADI_3g31415v3 [Brachypodium distachyon]|uniref:Uncharacterized protein n=1 Tax=Brachypodium distachyon TaxID=15368 RepID=A0A2K2D0D4_BRADI|nr:hypothetical protein BRADI_3g31415v3 [Brachypodium distachyon]